MIVFSAFTPHSPLLIESISKERYHDFDDTNEAMQKLAQSLEQTKPDVIVTISSHSQLHETVFSLNFHDSYKISLIDFGDHATTKSFKPDLELVALIRRKMRTEDFAFTIKSDELLEYGPGVPLLLLTKNLQANIIPISYSGLDAKMHLAFGRILKEIFSNSTKRIAIIASGDLSHCLSSDAPMGFKKEGRKFDNMILEAIKNVSSSKLLQISPDIIRESSECAYRPLLIFFGILERMNVRPDILSYKAPNGVGYLVAEIHHSLI